MKKHIIQFLLENQGFVSLDGVANALKQPPSIVRSEIELLEIKFPQLLYIKAGEDTSGIISVKIADYQDELARSLLL